MAARGRSLAWSHGTVTLETLGAMLGPTLFVLPDGGQVAPFHIAPWFEGDEEGSEPHPQVMHNWVEALIPGAGWRGFDPAFGLLADDTYVRVAVGRDARDVSPLRHASKGPGEEPEITDQVAVTRLGD